MIDSTMNDASMNSNPMKIMITGATGFIGRHLAALMHRQGHQLVLPSRGNVKTLNAGSAELPLWPIADFQSEAAWLAALDGVEVLVHLAGRAHVLNEGSADPAALFHSANVELPLMLAKLAAQRGVRRFVFVSSIGVMGKARTRPFSNKDEPAPRELYAQSKWAAEQALQQLCAKLQLELTIVRPPLVYGPAAPGNFGRLVKLAGLPVPLPLGAVHNQRSFVSVQNLADLLLRCCEHPAAAGQTFLVSDGDDISTTVLLRKLRQLMGKPVWLVPLPVSWLGMLCRLLGQANMQEKLLDSLQIDQQHTCQTLNWLPPLSVDAGLRLAIGTLQDCAASHTK